MNSADRYSQTYEGSISLRSGARFSNRIVVALLLLSCMVRGAAADAGRKWFSEQQLDVARRFGLITLSADGEPVIAPLELQTVAEGETAELHSALAEAR